MGRVPKIYEKLNRPFKTDRELVYNYQNAKSIKEWKDAAYELWDKYIRVVSIAKGQLSGIIKRYPSLHQLWDIVEDYEGVFWERFLNQLYGVELERCAHIQTWSLYQRVLQYAQTMNRNYIKQLIKKLKNEKEIKEHWEDDGTIVSVLDKQTSIEKPEGVESLYEKNLNQKIFWESIDELKKTLSDTQRKLLNMKIKNAFNYEIQNQLKMTASEYHNNMTVIKFQFGKIIENVAKKNGVNDHDYKKLCDELQ